VRRPPPRARNGNASRAGSRQGALGRAAEGFSRTVTDLAGTTPALIAAVGLIVLWLVSGPFFGFSDTWQLVINTTTTVVTFLMVFLIQRSQNKEAKAVAAKLNELIAAIEGASNRLIDVESLSEDELETMHRHFRRLAQLAKQDTSITASHSIEEAEVRHRRKKPHVTSRGGR
jgi:low affinity Fe/Cu permease